MKPVVLRADASPEIGTGHVMRLIALAEGVRRRGGVPSLAIGADVAPAISAFAGGRGVELVPVDAPTGSDTDARRVADLCRSMEAEACIVDGYRFGAGFFEDLRSSLAPDCVLVAIDDLGTPPIRVDLVVNPNYAAEAMAGYGRPSSTAFLLGPRFAMLRSEFLRPATDPGEERPSPDGRLRVLVTFGGSDVAGATARVVSLLRPYPVDVLAILGAAYSGQVVDENGPGVANVRVLRGVGDMSRLMRSVDLAISAAGSTLLELAYHRVPTLAFCVSENQERAGEALGLDGYLVYGGWFDRCDDTSLGGFFRTLIESAGERRRLRARLRGLVDGGGVDRILDAVEEISSRKRAHR